ncbi:unnamed protein product [Brugia timori]|uniref:Uncharacterized protein n=1 Tax=Brugia timori TaxID=42155 RepID=A0A0R3R364_9BILA|nr:unnamed protein product [Brugia timori]
MADGERPPPHAGYNTRGWRDAAESRARNPAQLKLCFLRLWCSGGRPLARAQDRLLGPCFKTGPGGTSILSLPIDSPPARYGKADGVRVNPSRARLQTPRAVSPSSRHRPSELSVATVGQATGTRGQLSGDLASCDAKAVS